MTTHKTGTREEWLAARLELPKAGKELTRRSDEVGPQRQGVPGGSVDKGSSFGGDFNFDFHVWFSEEQQRKGGIEYNYRREEPVVEIPSRSTSDGSATFAAMCGTDVPTYTRERPGMSAFTLEDGVVYHTYSTYARGLDGLWGMYQWLDRAPKGRNETGVWWRRHDVPRHVARDDDGDDAAVPGPDAVALPPRRWRDRRDAPRPADRTRGRGVLLRLDRVRNGSFSAGRRAGRDRDAAAGAGARRTDRGRCGRPDRRLAPAHRVEGASARLVPGGTRARPYAAGRRRHGLATRPAPRPPL